MFDNDDKKKIEQLLFKYKDSVNDITDLIGDDDPSKIFLTLLTLLGHLLDNEPSECISMTSVVLRKKLNVLFKILGPNFLSCPQVIENRDDLVNGVETGIPDKGIILPESPVIWMPNHHFKDDALATVLAAYRNAYIAFGSLPQFYNTIDGLTAWINGVIILNRKNKNSKKAFLEKASYLFDKGTDLILYPEGVWNKSPNKLVLDLWPGIYLLAKNNNVPVVPIVHYIDRPHLMEKDNLIRTVIDDPIDITCMSEKDALECLRDKLATWYYLLLEKYGKTTRDTLLDGYSTATEAWETLLKQRVSTADRYDSSIELSADYIPNDIVSPSDVFSAVANVKNINSDNIKLVLSAKKIVRDDIQNNFQRRF